MTGKKALDPGLASILESIRATVGGEAPAVPVEAVEVPAAAPAPPAARRAPPPPQRTVEEFLAELIRPQVDAWLAAHLPEIVQKLTAEEVARLLEQK
jgi:Protein of unknown function (DUF2497)